MTFREACERARALAAERGVDAVVYRDHDIDEDDARCWSVRLVLPAVEESPARRALREYVRVQIDPRRYAEAAASAAADAQQERESVFDYDHAAGVARANNSGWYYED